MKGFKLEDLNYNFNLKNINKQIDDLKDEINEKMDSYFIDENEYVYKAMMKSYTGDKHKVFEDEEKTVFKEYNEYKNPFLNQFKK